jgi:hypothetical protein
VKIAIVVRASFALFFALLKHKVMFWKHLGHLFSKDTAQFSLFLGLFSGGYKIMLCFLRSLTKKNSKWHAALSGFLAGLSIGLEKSRRRKMIS